jgi:DNA-binding transcriptional MerR regulator/predicted N-acetyltransferase YhbS
MGQQVRSRKSGFLRRLDLDQRSDLMIGVVDDMMSIGEFSSRCGLSPKVLRSYAEAGVLDPAAVDPATGYRYYGAAQLEEADTVRLLRRAGVGLAEIARFLGAPTLDALDDWERSLTAETLSRREALAQVRCRLGRGPMRTRGATVIELRPVRDAEELATAFDLLGAQLPQPIDSNDWRFDDLAHRFPADQSIMVLAAADGNVVGGALAFREDNGAVALRIVGVVESFRHRGIGRLLVERVETGARLLAAHTVALGTDEAIGFWYHLGYTPHLILQWAYDPDLYEAELEAVLSGPLSGLRFWRSSFNDVPQLFVELDEPRLDLRRTVQAAVAGCHVGFMMSKKFLTSIVRPAPC